MGISILGTYLRAVGYKCIALMMLLIGLDQLSKVAASFWLSEWTSNAELHNLTALPADSDERYQNNIYYLGIYGSLGIVQGNWKYEMHFGFALILRIYPKMFCIDIDIKASVLY